MVQKVGILWFVAALVAATYFFPELYTEQVATVGIALTLLVGWRLRLTSHPSVVCFMTYVTCHTFFILGFGGESFNSILTVVRDSFIGRTWMFMLVCSLAATCVGHLEMSTIFRVLGILNIGLTFLHYYFGTGAIGLSNVTSINSCITAMLLPFVGNSWLILAGVYAIYLGGGSIAWGMLGLYALIQPILHPNKKLLAGGVALAGVLGLVYVSQVMEDGAWNNQRFQFYGICFRYWIDGGWNTWLGTGWGSFTVIGPKLQLLQHFDVNAYWAAVHSDWLQLLLETGPVGLLLGLWVYVTLMVRAYQLDRRLLLTMVGAGGFGLFYHPLRLPLVAFLVALIVTKLMWNDESLRT